jgi:hypothetical protein
MKEALVVEQPTTYLNGGMEEWLGQLKIVSHRYNQVPTSFLGIDPQMPLTEAKGKMGKPSMEKA